MIRRLLIGRRPQEAPAPEPRVEAPWEAHPLTCRCRSVCGY